MSGDREKIEIIRKKSEANEVMNFDFDMNDAMGIPEPPEPPVFEYDFDIEESASEEIEKEINGQGKNDSTTIKEDTTEETK